LPRWSRGTAPTLAAAAAVAAAVLLGVALRAADPLGNPVLAAEDPYTHLILVREHLADGRLDPLHDGGTLYPPGLHGVLAAFAVLGGADLYPLMQFGPVLFGAIAMLGTAAVLGRYEGIVAAFVGVLAVAVMPEHIARTTLMAPTALDLALLPLLVWSLLEVLQGRLAWLAAAAPVSLFLVLAHPWVLAIVAGGGFAALVLYVLFPWHAARHARPTLRGTSAAMALVAASLGLAAASRWRASGTGFAELGEPVLGTMTIVVIAVPLLLAFAAAHGLWRRARNLGHDAPVPITGPRSTDVQLVGAALLAVGLAVTAWLATQGGLPKGVDPAVFLGVPILGIAVLGLLALPRIGSPVVHAAAGLFFATLPLVVFNPLGNPLWPERSVVFLGFAAVLVVGAATARFAEGAGALMELRARSRAARKPTKGTARRAIAPGAVAALFVVASTGAALVAATPGPLHGGWYRYYDACEFAALKAVGEEANAADGSLVVAGSWEAGLVVSTFATREKDVWFKSDVFQSEAEASDFTAWRSGEPGPTFVVLERYLPKESPHSDLGFLHRAPYQLDHTSCAGDPPPAAEVSVYVIRPGGRSA